MGIKPILVVIAVGARQCDVKTQAEIQCQFGRYFPVILRKESILIVRSGWPELDFFVGPATVAGTALRHLAHHEARHRISAAEVQSAGAGISAIGVEAEESNGSVGLDVVNLVNSAIKPELDLVLAVYLVERGRELSCVLAQAVIAVGIGANIGISGRGVRVDKDRGNSLEPVGL